MATAPESHYVLDGILGNQTDLPVTEHATDTHGATLANFALFDLLGLQLSSRIRDLGKSTLYRTGPKAEFASRYPSAGQLLARRLNEELITACGTTCCASPPPSRAGTPPSPWWSASYAHPAASRAPSPRLSRSTARCAAPSTNSYLADEAYRRRISRQLKGREPARAAPAADEAS